MAPGTRIVADNKSKAEASTINTEITKITIKSKIAILRPIPFGRRTLRPDPSISKKALVHPVNMLICWKLLICLGFINPERTLYKALPQRANLV